jgi:hypothetical protein
MDAVRGRTPSSDPQALRINEGPPSQSGSAPTRHLHTCTSAGRGIPRHPEIERIMHEEVGQDRTDYALNAKDNFQFERKIFGWRRHHCVLDLRRKR